MRFEEILPYIREYKKVRRRSWKKGFWILWEEHYFDDNGGNTYHIEMEEDVIDADDWELFERVEE